MAFFPNVTVTTCRTRYAGIGSLAAVVDLEIITCTVCARFMLPALFELIHHKLAFRRSRKNHTGSKF